LMVTNADTGLGGFNEIYIVSELMETDLHRVIYSRQPLSEEHIQYFVYQILRALKYIHSAGVVHRDLKPSNLLLNSTCDLKVCDFGLARGLKDIQLQLTEYVVTRWYRAPEIMLACREYTLAIDIWSVGCIFAEMLGRKPLFPGDDYLHQLKLISAIVGTPQEADLHFVTSEKALKFMRGLPIKPKAELGEMFPKANKDAVDLLEKMLKFDPYKRIAVEDALAHPYLATLHHPEDEPVCETTFAMKDDVPDDDLKKRDIQTAILEEVFKLRPELERTWMPHLMA
jgi:serine/threonine protein kinase